MLTSCIIQPHNKETALEPMTFFHDENTEGMNVWGQPFELKEVLFFSNWLFIHLLFISSFWNRFTYCSKCFWHFVQQHIYYHHTVSYLVLLYTIFHPAPPTFWMKIKLIDFSFTKCHAKLFFCHFFFMNMKKKINMPI